MFIPAEDNYKKKKYIYTKKKKKQLSENVNKSEYLKSNQQRIAFA